MLFLNNKYRYPSIYDENAFLNFDRKSNPYIKKNQSILFYSHQNLHFELAVKHEKIFSPT